MASTFGTLNTAFTGLSAARQGTAVTGQNIANAGTEGYTRQRVETSSVNPAARTGLFSTGPTPGQGVTVGSISRLGSDFNDARVRSTAADAGYAAARAEAMYRLESGLQEPGEHGISASLQSFWNSWHDVANSPGESAPASVLLEETAAMVTRISQGYTAIENQWAEERRGVDAAAAELNSAAAQVADLNDRIRTAQNLGNGVNELLDQRNMLTSRISELVGGTVRDSGDGTVEVLVGGNALVSGTTVNKVSVTGGYRMQDAAVSPVQLEWAHRPGSPIAVTGGEVTGALSILAPANGTAFGGDLAEAAEAFNKLATDLHSAVNAIHSTGSTPDGTTGLDFFALDPTRPAAKGLSVIPTDASGIASGKPGLGALDGSMADRISQPGSGAGSPDDNWSVFVTRLGATTRADLQTSVLADTAANSAVTAQLSGASVDFDEESMNLVAYQHAYQAAARVMTAVDEMLDVLINRTGIVGR